jgi:hypothetical protein
LSITRTVLETHFRAIDNDALMRGARQESLTDPARDVAHAELKRRDMTDPHADPSHDAAGKDAQDDSQRGDLVILTRFFSPTEGHLLKGCLEANGVPAYVADSHLVQAYQPLSDAFGGVRVMVHESDLAEAAAIVTSFNAGEFAIDEDYDIDSEQSGQYSREPFQEASHREGGSGADRRWMTAQFRTMARSARRPPPSETTIARRPMQIAPRSTPIAEQEMILATRSMFLAGRDIFPGRRSMTIVSRERWIGRPTTTIASRETTIAWRSTRIVSKEIKIVSGETTIATRETCPARKRG